MNLPQLLDSLQRAFKALLSLLPPLAVGLLSCIILALLSGAQPFDVIIAIWNGAWGSWNSALTTLTKVTPLLLTGLAVALAYQANLLNIGCEGQLTLGALSAASFAVVASPLPGLVLAPLTLLVGALVGGLWALPPVWLRQKRGVHEVISTLLLNYLAIYLADYLVLGPWETARPWAVLPKFPPEQRYRPCSRLALKGSRLRPLRLWF